MNMDTSREIAFPRVDAKVEDETSTRGMSFDLPNDLHRMLMLERINTRQPMKSIIIKRLLRSYENHPNPFD